MFCSNCGSELDANANFCPSCGNKCSASAKSPNFVLPEETQVVPREQLEIIPELNVHKISWKDKLHSFLLSLQGFFHNEKKIGRAHV